MALCLIALLSEQSGANLKLGVEPYLGYGQFSYSSAGSPEESKFGAILGGKGGVFLNEDLWVALDYHLGGPYHLEQNKNEFLNRMWGAGVGLLKKPARFWVGYYYDAEIDDVERNVLIKGTALKISMGYEYESKLAINIEYIRQSYSEGKYQGVSRPLTLDVNVVYVSLSSPLFFE